MRDPFSSLRVVSLTDPALDMSDSERKAYTRSRDPAAVKIRLGHKPVWFTIKRIDALFSMQFLDGPDPFVRYMLGLRAGLIEIEWPTGEKWVPQYQPQPGAFGVRLATDESIRDVAEKISLRRAMEIGELAAHLAMLDEEAFDPLSPAPGPAPTG